MRMNMNETQETIVDWNEAYTDKYINIGNGDSKVLYLKNWKLVKSEKSYPDGLKTVVEFIADCISEDGRGVNKSFSTTSDRLKKLLQPFIEPVNKEVGVLIRITRFGEGPKTQWSVKNEGVVLKKRTPPSVDEVLTGVRK
jgi:hypothetical protein